MLILIPAYIIITILRYLYPDTPYEMAFLVFTGIMLSALWRKIIGDRKLPINLEEGQSVPLHRLPELEDFLVEKNRVFSQLGTDFTRDLRNQAWVVYDPLDLANYSIHLSAHYAQKFNESEGPLVAVPFNTFMHRIRNLIQEN